MQSVEPREVRYIKFGRGGRWVDAALARDELHFGYSSISHQVAQSGDWEGVVRQFLEEGRSRGKASDMAREVKDFYSLGDDCLWVTFAKGHLWWAFATPEVKWIGGDGETEGQRTRKTRGPWTNLDVAGKPLRLDELSTRLTQTAAYQQTICSVRASDYLLRRINGIEEPSVVRAREARRELIESSSELIASLHWADFETMVDLIFGRSGWQRISRVGGSQKDTDLVMEQPTTNERAFVQVKSRAPQRVLDDYISRFVEDGGYERMFFVCHSPVGSLVADADRRVHLWTGQALAEMVVKAGLFDWLLEKTA